MKLVNPGTDLSRFAEQLHLHDVCAFLFQKSAYAECSTYALPKYLGLIQGNDLDCCRWVMEPPRGAGGVREFTNYGSLRLVEEGCSQRSESGCCSRTPSQTPPDLDKVDRDVGFFISTFWSYGGSKAALLRSFSAFSVRISL